MRLRKSPFTEFKRISTTLDDFSPLGTSPIFMINIIPIMDLELRNHDLISYMNPMSPQCLSRNIVKNGTCVRKLENGTVFRVQRPCAPSCDGVPVHRYIVCVLFTVDRLDLPCHVRYIQNTWMYKDLSVITGYISNDP